MWKWNQMHINTNKHQSICRRNGIKLRKVKIIISHRFLWGSSAISTQRELDCSCIKVDAKSNAQRGSKGHRNIPLTLCILDIVKTKWRTQSWNKEEPRKRRAPNFIAMSFYWHVTVKQKDKLTDLQDSFTIIPW